MYFNVNCKKVTMYKIINILNTLAALKELLDIQTPHHRALADALSAANILQHCISKLPFYIKSTQDLLNFSKSTLKERKAMSEPVLLR